MTEGEMSMLGKKSEIMLGFILFGTLYRVFLLDLSVKTPFLPLIVPNL
jgi:hypothetical protein